VGKPKQPQVIILDGGPHADRLALFMAAAHAHQFPARASITAPPVPAPALEKREKPVLARAGSFLRRAALPFFPPATAMFGMAHNRAEILARVNAFYSRRPRPWRPRANAPRVRHRAYTAPKVRACS
jgi:hypothetical protein